MAGREVIRRAEKIRVVLMDVDGVWTDGTLYYAPDGGEVAEFKGVNAQDGMGLRWAHAAGIKTGLISGRDAPGVTYRAEMLGVTYIYQNFLEKIPPYEEICKDAGVGDDEVAYMGDDLPDVPLIRRVGLGVAVANARREVKREADFVTQAAGGDGAIREVLELIMRARGMWQEVLDRYGIE